MRSLILLSLLCLSFPVFSQNFSTEFERSNGTRTPAYSDIIKWWKNLGAASDIVKMSEMGPSDAGFPLHLILVSADKNFDIRAAKAKNKNIILINNGIHPGEPDGIDASMELVKNIVLKKYKLPSNVLLAIIPVYNIGGCLNRSSHYRVDQNGPEQFGFRGNSENLDLNRDFIKCDSKEAISFAKIFHLLDPDILIDNHVSDGADYQHIMTLLSTQHNKLGGAMGDFLHDKFEPALFSLMKGKGYDLVPYVNHSGLTPDNGWDAYWDSPRYSSGYAALWSTFSFMPETHMLKPYKQRVESDIALMESFIEFASANSSQILNLRKETRNKEKVQESFPVSWKLDKSTHDDISYKGYKAEYKPSDVSGLQRLYYNRSMPFDKIVPFFNTYVDTLSVKKPVAYIIPQGWWKVIERLNANNVQMRKLTTDTSIQVAWYKIENYQSGSRQYEGHHPNNRTKVLKNIAVMKFRKGDYFISLNQTANRFLIETLEPYTEDSYFTWNFFDPVLGQKEGISDYHFEDVASRFIKDHPEIRDKLNERRNKDSAFSKNADQQLNFVFENSPYFEPAYLQYPVYSILK